MSPRDWPRAHARTLRWSTWISITVVIGLLSGCASMTSQTQDAKQPRATQLIAATTEYTILIAGSQDTFRSLAKQYLGDERRYWVIADLNQLDDIRPGREIIIPHQPQNSTGVYADGYQTVPILVYHRFGSKADKLTLTPEMF